MSKRKRTKRQAIVNKTLHRIIDFIVIILVDWIWFRLILKGQDLSYINDENKLKNNMSPYKRMWFALLAIVIVSLLIVTECLRHKWSRICPVCRNHNNPVNTSFMIYHRVCNKSNSVTSGAGTAYLSRALLVIPGF